VVAYKLAQTGRLISLCFIFKRSSRQGETFFLDIFSVSIMWCVVEKRTRRPRKNNSVRLLWVGIIRFANAMFSCTFIYIYDCLSKFAIRSAQRIRCRSSPSSHCCDLQTYIYMLYLRVVILRYALLFYYFFNLIDCYTTCLRVIR